jgi:predicted nucleotidyltransferase
MTAPSLRDDRHLLRILAVLREALADTECRVYLFGSRATGRHRAASDYDIGVEARGDVTRRLSRAREVLEGSTIPVAVDLVDLTEASPAMVQKVAQEGIQLWNSFASA